MITDGSHPSHMDPGPAQTLSSTALQSTTQQPWAPAFDLPSLTAVSPWLAGASIDLERMFDYGYGTAQAFLERALGPVSPARPLPPGRRRHLGHRGPQRRGRRLQPPLRAPRRGRRLGSRPRLAGGWRRLARADRVDGDPKRPAMIKHQQTGPSLAARGSSAA